MRRTDADVVVGFGGYACVPVYLAAAAHLGVSPARCLVVEDTPTGIQAGVAAGATVWAYAPPGVDAAPLLATGAQRVFAHMADLATLLGH